MNKQAAILLMLMVAGCTDPAHESSPANEARDQAAHEKFTHQDNPTLNVTEKRWRINTIPQEGNKK